MESLLEAGLIMILYQIEAWCYRKVSKAVKGILYGIQHKTQDNCLEQLRVIHKSDHFLVVNKDHDIIINSDERTDFRFSLYDQINYRYPELHNPGLGHGFYVLHRLDFSTSGIVAVPLHKTSCAQAVKQFQERKTEKFYLAIVRGHINYPYLDINYPIGDDSRPKWERLKMCTADKSFCLKPRNSRTRLMVLERGLYGNYPATKVMLAPITGRRHQLRVHCSEIGHTIVGDYTYSDRKDILPHRMFLHAFRLILNTPLENLDITTPDPFSEKDPLNKWTVTERLTPVESAFNLIHSESVDWCVIK